MTRKAAPSFPEKIPSEFRRGDFSRLLTKQKIQLYDPLTTDAKGIRQPFPNNQIPVQRINPVARAPFERQDLYPEPLTSDLRFNQINVRNSYILTDQREKGMSNWP